MNKLLLIFFVFWFGICESQGQYVTIRGRVTHASDGLSYAAIFTEDTSIGVAADTAGYFRLNVPALKIASKLVISCLGYTSRSIEVPPKDTVINIELQPYINILNEVIVYAKTDSAKQIIEKMLGSVDKNYAHYIYEAQAFYSETVRQSKKFVKTSEALVRIQDRGYEHPIEKDGLVLFKIEQLRTKGEGPDLSWIEALANWFFEKNGVYLTLKDDPLRKKKIFNWFETVGSGLLEQSNTETSFLASPNFLEGYNFHLDSISKINNQDVYCLSFYNNNSEALSVGEGNLFIQKKDFALIEYRARLIKTKKRDPINWNLYAPLKDSTLYECHAKYREVNGKYFLHYLASKSLGNNSSFLTRNHKQGTTGMVYQYKQLIVKTILTEGFKKMKPKESYPIDEDIADAKVKYDKVFWENQNILTGKDH
ncbi:MAG: carboxypeptidase-like regulatory domain-containing protein [Cyclobacteriaceae bacterium]|nr:carboxypeptidase-like regulatory domain-containing protein [Cyclobacteriaceae bacterium]